MREYVYLGVIFFGPCFSLRRAVDARLARGYATLGSLENQCAHIQFQEPRTKLWLFDTLLTPTLLYGVEVWGCSLYHRRLTPLTDQSGSERDYYDGWDAMERPLVMMISRMIRSKGSTPHSIVRAELGAAPMVVEALFRAVSFLHRIREFSGQRYSRLALVSSQQIAAEGDKDCWYSQMTTWLSLHGLDIDRLPPYNYSLDCPTLNFSRSELNQVIRADILRIDTERTWIRPSLPLGSRMEFYRSHFLHLTQDGFVTQPQYMDIHLTHSMRATIGQIRTASHRLRTETGRWTDIAEEDKIC